MNIKVIKEECCDDTSSNLNLGLKPISHCSDSGEVVNFLELLNSKQDKPNQIFPAVTITYNPSGLGTLTIPSVSGIINGVVVIKPTTTTFTPVPLSQTGNQRYISIYLNSSGSVLKLEGVEDTVAVLPLLPDNTALIGTVLVNDIGLVVLPPPIIGYGGVRTYNNLNTYEADQSLLNNTTGFQNIAVGAYSLSNNTTGDKNTAIGAYSLSDNQIGRENTAVGWGSLPKGGYFNTAIGALTRPLGNRNTVIGNNTMVNGIGNDNIAIGRSTAGNFTGNDNIIIGTESFNTVSSGNGNTVLGKYSIQSGNIENNKVTITDGVGNIVFQADATNRSSGRVLVTDANGVGRYTNALDGKQDKPNSIFPAVTIVYDSTGMGTLTVPSVSGIIGGLSVNKPTTTTFTPVPLSASGQQRYIVTYLTSTGQVLKAEGLESEVAIVPTLVNPELKAIIGTVLVTSVAVNDAGLPDLTNYVTKGELINVEGLKGTTTGAGEAYVLNTLQYRTIGYNEYIELSLNIHTPNTIESPTIQINTPNIQSPQIVISDKDGLPLIIGDLSGSVTLRLKLGQGIYGQFRYMESARKVVGTTILNKTQADLSQDTNLNWFLPWLDNTGQPILDLETQPLAVEVNGVTMPINQLDRSFTPPRLSAQFQDSTVTQAIKVLISKSVVTQTTAVAFSNISGFTGTNQQLIAGDGSLVSNRPAFVRNTDVNFLDVNKVNTFFNLNTITPGNISNGSEHTGKKILIWIYSTSPLNVTGCSLYNLDNGSTSVNSLSRGYYEFISFGYAWSLIFSKAY